MDQTILTPEGEKKLHSELKELKLRRKIITDKIARAKELGDLKENAEYHASREEQSFNEGRIQDIEFILKTAKVIAKDTKSDKIGLGSQVTIIDNDGGKFTYDIVGSSEASVLEKKISIDSPVARAMIGKKINDQFEVKLPVGVKKYKIIKIV